MHSEVLPRQWKVWYAVHTPNLPTSRPNSSNHDMDELTSNTWGCQPNFFQFSRTPSKSVQKLCNWIGNQWIEGLYIFERQKSGRLLKLPTPGPNIHLDHRIEWHTQGRQILILTRNLPEWNPLFFMVPKHLLWDARRLPNGCWLAIYKSITGIDNHQKLFIYIYIYIYICASQNKHLCVIFPLYLNLKLTCYI